MQLLSKLKLVIEIVYQRFKIGISIMISFVILKIYNITQVI